MASGRVSRGNQATSRRLSKNPFHLNILFGEARTRTGSSAWNRPCQGMDARGVAAETVVALWKHKQAFGGGYGESVWCFAQSEARNSCIMPKCQIQSPHNNKNTTRAHRHDTAYSTTRRRVAAMHLTTRGLALSVPCLPHQPFCRVTCSDNPLPFP